MITLYFFGSFFARLVGQGRFLTVYFIGGIVGSLFFLLLGNPVSILVGASGAVFALAGAMVVIVPRLKVMVYFIMPMPLWVVVVIFYGLWSIPGLVAPDIAWQAHLGGLLTGLIAGYIFKKQMRLQYYR
jgi:membrane associated rhomboid family serine protease